MSPASIIGCTQTNHVPSCPDRNIHSVLFVEERIEQTPHHSVHLTH